MVSHTEAELAETANTLTEDFSYLGKPILLVGTRVDGGPGRECGLRNLIRASFLAPSVGAGVHIIEANRVVPHLHLRPRELLLGRPGRTMRDRLSVAVAVKPRILGEMLAKPVADNFGARVRSVNPDEADVLRLAKLRRAHFVILSANEPRAHMSLWQEILRRSRQTRVILLGVSSDFALGLRYEERFRATRIEHSVRGILTALSGSADEGQPVGTVAPLVYPTGPLAEGCAELLELNRISPRSEEWDAEAGEESENRLHSAKRRRALLEINAPRNSRRDSSVPMRAGSGNGFEIAGCRQ